MVRNGTLRIRSSLVAKTIQNLTGERIFDRIVGFCFVLRSIKRLNYKGSWEEMLMRNLVEIRWHGRGGQGAKTAALLLAESALEEGKYIQGFPEYGPERMGAPIQSFTRISEVPITLHSHVRNPDAVVVLDSTLMDTIDVAAGLSEEGVLLINTSQSPQEIRQKLNLKKRKVFTVDASSISLDILGRNLPNTPMLGALIKATDLLGIDTIISAIKHKFEKKFSSRILEGNIQAIRRAYEEAKGE